MITDTDVGQVVVWYPNGRTEKYILNDTSSFIVKDDPRQISNGRRMWFINVDESIPDCDWWVKNKRASRELNMTIFGPVIIDSRGNTFPHLKGECCGN